MNPKTNNHHNHTSRNNNNNNNNNNRRKNAHGFMLESVLNPGWCLQMSHLCQGAMAHLVPKNEAYSSNAQKWKYHSNTGTLTHITFQHYHHPNNNNNNNNNLVLDIVRGSAEPGITVCMWPKNGKSHQSWRLIPSSSTTTTNNNNSNKNNEDEIVIVQTQQSSRHVLQAETIMESNNRDTTNNNKDEYATTTTANVIMWPSTGEDSQKWRLLYTE